MDKKSPDSARTGRLFIVSAPSGAGKTTLCNAVLKKFPDLCYSISHTTRAPRPGEHDGVDYFFISEDEFKDRIRQDIWAEWAEVYGHYYGTSERFLNRHLSAGKDILLDIDYNGTRQILTKYPDSITIFIMPPSLASLKQRLLNRGTDSEETIARRLENAKTEMAQKDHYRHIVVNDSLPRAIDTLSAILSAHHAG